jgi:hypothetical protein
MFDNIRSFNGDTIKDTSTYNCPVEMIGLEAFQSGLVIGLEYSLISDKAREGKIAIV